MAPDDIDAPMLLTCLRRVENRGVVYSAHRTRALGGHGFRYAIATGRAERDPSQDLKGAIPPAKTKNFAAITDPEQAGGLLMVIDGYKGTCPVRCALQLAPLLFGLSPSNLFSERFAKLSVSDQNGSETLLRS